MTDCWGHQDDGGWTSRVPLPVEQSAESGMNPNTVLEATPRPGKHGPRCGGAGTGEWAVPESQLLPCWGERGSGLYAALPQQSLRILLIHARCCLMLCCNAQLCKTWSLVLLWVRTLKLREVCDFLVVTQLISDRAGTSTYGLLTPGPVFGHPITANSGPRLWRPCLHLGEPFTSLKSLQGGPALG